MIDGNLSEAVISLHDIARLIEQRLGKSNLTEDVRQCADRLHELLKAQANK